MRKILLLVIIGIILLSLSATPAMALTIKENAYPGAFDHDEYMIPGERPRDLSSGNQSSYRYDAIIRGRVSEKGTRVDIDHVYIQYPEDLNEVHEEILEYPFKDPDGEEEKYVGKATTYVRNEIRVELGKWDQYVERMKDTHTLETLHGRPALVRETGSREFGENTESGNNAQYKYEAIVMVNDKHVDGYVLLKYSVSLTYKIIGFGLGYGWEENWDGFDEKQKAWWEERLSDFDNYLEKASDVHIEINRDRIYKGEIGAEPAKEDNKEQDKKEPANVVKNTWADKEKGETGMPIPVAVAIAVIGIGAALAGAGVGGNDGDKDGSAGKSRFKMCLRKEFGDAIRYDSQPVTVYSRIVEITHDGEEKDRPDLTEAIDIFSGGGLSVEDATMTDNYKGALVYAQYRPGEANPETGVVSIKFAGEGGSLQNNVTFRLIGKPYISFPEQGKYLTMTMPMLMGDEEVYETPFILNDFMEKPQSIKIEPGEGAPISCEVEETDENTYVLRVKNNSPKPEPNKARKQSCSIGLRAENEKELAENTVKVELYPEGITVREARLDENDRVLIPAFETEADDGAGEIKAIRFVVDFVVPETDEKGKRTVRVMEKDEFAPVFADVKGTDERTMHLGERLKYEIEEAAGNLKEYRFIPQEALVEEEGKPYIMVLPISCDYGDKEYTLDLPVRLIGGGPGPMDGWEEEFAKMKRIVSRVGGISPEIARVLREHGRKMSTAEIRLINKRICHDAIVYYTKDAAEYGKIADELDNMIYYAEWIKWFGDQAFSYLVGIYMGPTADAILSPAKDIFTAFLGEAIATLESGEKFDFDQLQVGKNIAASFDNLIGNAFDNKMSTGGINFKQACAVIGGFVVWKIGKNLYDNMDKTGKIDLYSAITATASDLSAVAMKKIAGNYFDKALNNKTVQENLSTPLANWLQDIVPDVTQVKWKNSNEFEMLEFAKAGAIKKYLEEFFGMGMAKVVEIDTKAAKAVYEHVNKNSIASTLEISWPEISWVHEVTNSNKETETFKISIDLKGDVIDKLYEYLFDQLFKLIPFAAAVKPVPTDPPYLA